MFLTGFMLDSFMQKFYFTLITAFQAVLFQLFDAVSLSCMCVCVCVCVCVDALEMVEYL